jgi:hypothetical protein
MGENLGQIPVHVRDHILKITASAGLEDNEESVELIAHAWLEIKSLFEQRIGNAEMEEWDEFPSDEDRGALVLTYSGSLITLGPLVEGKRTVEYTSIGLRKDVPESASSEASELKKDVCIDESAVFSGGPIEKSSAVYKIAVAREKLELAVEQELLGELTQVLAEDFVEVNKTLIAT